MWSIPVTNRKSWETNDRYAPEDPNQQNRIFSLWERAPHQLNYLTLFGDFSPFRDKFRAGVSGRCSILAAARDNSGKTNMKETKKKKYKEL